MVRRDAPDRRASLVDRLTASLVVSNVALAIAVVALVAALARSPAPPIAPGEADVAPAIVTLVAAPCPSGGGCRVVNVTGIDSPMVLWRFSVSLYVSYGRIIDPPVTLLDSGNLFAGPGDGVYLNFSDEDIDGNLSVGDGFQLEGLNLQTNYSIRLFWAATGHQIAHVQIPT